MKRRTKQPASVRRPRFLNSVGVLLLLLGAVGVGLLLPELGAAIQERSTDRMNQTVNLGESSLSLTSDDSKLEKLRLIGYILNNKVDYMQLENGQVLTAAKAAEKLEDVAALLDGTGLGINGLTKSDLIGAVPTLLVANADSFATNLVWCVEYGRSIDEEWTSLDYIIDDATGLILAVEFCRYDGQSGDAVPDSSLLAQKLVQNLSDSYDFAGTSLSIGGSAQVDRYSTMYTVNYTNSQGTVLGLPVIMGEDYWAINYYEGW